jgi:LysM repeat protein
MRSRLRYLAPAALLVFVVVLIVVVASSLGGGSSGGGGGESAAPAAKRSRPAAKGQSAPLSGRRTYTVKTGDTLGGIADRTGVTLSRLQELNPGLDPQSLVAGQKLRLR